MSDTVLSAPSNVLIASKWALRLAPGLLVFALALLSPTFRRADGSLLPLGGSLIVGAISLTVIISGWRTRWQRCAALFSLAIAGQACALQLLDAPPYSVYQRYFSWNQAEFSWPRLLDQAYLFPLVGLLIQTIIVLGFSRTLLPKAKNYFYSVMTPRKGVLLVSFILFVSVLFSQNVLRYGFELLFTMCLAIVGLLNLVLVASSVPTEFLTEVNQAFKRRVGNDSIKLASRFNRVIPWLLAAWVVAVASAIASSVFERVPHIPDDVSYLFQAKYFSTGQLFLPAPPVDASFTISHVINDGSKWFAYGFPGWPLILALGVLAGAPWLVNPVLGGVTILLAHVVVRRFYGWNFAHATALLLAASPQFLFTSASFMAHTSSVVWLLLALLCVDKERTRNSGLWGIVGGACLGFLFLTRPLEGLLMGAVIGLWALGVGGARLGPRGLAGFMAACLLVGAAIFPYNYILTGSATYSPQMKWTDETWYPGADRLGFGSNIGNVNWPHIDPLPGHGPVDVIINANKNFYMTNFELFGWGFGSLLFVGLMLLLRGWQKPDWLFVGIAVAIIVGHSLYWCSGGPDFGARYWYQALLPYIVLTVRGVQMLKQYLIEQGITSVSASRVPAFVTAATFVALITVMPWRSLGKYYHYRGMNGDVTRLAKEHDFSQSLVFVQVTDQEDYASAFVLNSPTLEGPKPIYVRDAGDANNEALRRHYPNRPVWVVGRSPVDGEQFRVLAGPLTGGGDVAKN